MSQPVAITSLAEQSPVTATDVLLLMVEGIAKKATVGGVREALPVATSVAKGLMSASDKQSLEDLIYEMSQLLTPPAVTIASGSTITVPTGAKFVTLTGTTSVTAVNGLVNNRSVLFYYPVGAGLTFLGHPIKEGDAPLEVVQTAT